MNDLNQKNMIDEQLGRINQVTGTNSQLELANFLGLRQSAISDAKRRGQIPTDWLIRIMITCNVHPSWILTGNGPRHTSVPRHTDHYETNDEAQERRAKEEALRILSARDLADELLRRIAVAQANSSARRQDYS